MMTSNKDREETIERIMHDTFHADYFSLTLEAFRSLKKQSRPEKYWYLNRDCLDTIFYAYSCIETSVEYIYSYTQFPDTWLSRHLKRIWDKLSLSDKIGFMTYARFGKAFWKNQNQIDLFDDLRTLRNGLVHLGVYRTKETGTFIYAEESSYPSLKPGSYKAEEVTETFLVKNKNKIAEFNNNPRNLNIQDAEQAVEIMLRILLQLDEHFQVHDLACLYSDVESGGLLHADDILLKELHCHFEETWNMKEA